MLENVLIGIVAIVLGLIVAFAGYPLFRLVLPIAGLVYGFMLGNAVFSSWLVGVIAGLALAVVFAIAAYAIWSFAIGFAGAVLGMSVGAGIGTSFNLSGWFTLLIAVALGALFLVLAMKLKDVAVMIATAASGAGMVAYGAAVILPSIFGQPGSYSFLYFLVWIAVGVVAFIVQFQLFRDAHRYADMIAQSQRPLAR